MYRAKLATVAACYDEVVMIGDSMGATAALLFSDLATSVHAFCPQVRSAINMDSGAICESFIYMPLYIICECGELFAWTIFRPPPLNYICALLRGGGGLSVLDMHICECVFASSRMLMYAPSSILLYRHLRYILVYLGIAR